MLRGYNCEADAGGAGIETLDPEARYACTVAVNEPSTFSSTATPNGPRPVSNAGS